MREDCCTVGNLSFLVLGVYLFLKFQFKYFYFAV
jgi:hypothetical protein